MKALVLAGGFGTRLRPLSCTRPKTLFPIVNKPLLQWTIERLAENNVTEAILAVNYQTEIAIKQSTIQKCGVHIAYSRDPPKKPLGTAGPIKKAEKQIGNDAAFLVLNGDIFSNVDYSEVLKKHEKEHRVATIVLHKAEDPSRYGVAEMAAGNRIVRFIEKPSPEKAPTNLINAGVYVFSPEIFTYIPKGRKVSLENEVFPKLAEEGELYGYVFEGLWTDIGKPEDYLEINRLLLKSHISLPKNKMKNNAKIRNPSALDKGVSIGERSVVGPYAVLGQNVTVGNDTKIRNSIILSGTAISDFCSINGAIIGENVHIGKNVRIDEKCIVGDHVKIGDNAKLTKNVSICPAKEIRESILTPKCVS